MAGRTGPDVRQQLEETLTENVIVPVEVGPVLDALAPLVECIANERAAKALEDAADILWDETGAGTYVYNYLKDGAKALRESAQQEVAR